MDGLVWICVSLVMVQVDSYVLMTAKVDDIHTLARRVLTSPIVKQLKDIWRGATQSFNSHYTHFRADEDEDNTDATYVLARKVLKTPLAQRVKDIWRSASESFRKHYRAEFNSDTDSIRDTTSNDQRQNIERRKAMDEFLALGRNASVYLLSMKELLERL